MIYLMSSSYLGRLLPEAEPLDSAQTLEYFGQLSGAFLVRYSAAQAEGQLIYPNELVMWKTLLEAADFEALSNVGIEIAPLMVLIEDNLQNFAKLIGVLSTVDLAPILYNQDEIAET